MKHPALAAALLSALLFAGSAHAYAIYNHLDYKVCVQNSASSFFLLCDIKISPHSVHNGAHGSGLKHHTAMWKGDGACWITDYFDIPDGGFARIDTGRVKIYKHDGKEVDSKDFLRMDYNDCPGPIPGKD